jgi:RHS repeat-associated protein
MQMPGRQSPLIAGDEHRYGFQGQELDDEIKGGRGTSVNYKYRMHDPRVGRFFAVDPLVSTYPYWSPYVFSGNQVIHMLELEGLEPATPPIPNYTFPSGEDLKNEKDEAQLLPLTPPDASTVFTFEYTGFGTNNHLSLYSAWQYDVTKDIWTGVSRYMYKNTKNGVVPTEIQPNPPHGCVQKGVFLGDCYNVGSNSNGVAQFENEIDSPRCPITISDYTETNTTGLYSRIVRNAKRAVATSINGNVTTRTTGVTILLNNAIYTNDDVKQMKYDLRVSGRFVGVNLDVQLVPKGELMTLDSEDDPTQEVGAVIETTTETKTKISDGNR